MCLNSWQFSPTIKHFSSSTHLLSSHPMILELLSQD
ncbi:hypothetical protein ACHAWX_001201 [Stephanocyclus meneghinianus]